MYKFVLVLFAVSVASFASGDEEESKAFVYDSLARYQNAEEALKLSGYACMARGLLSHPPHQGSDFDGNIVPTLLISCCRKDFISYVHSTQTTSSSFGFREKTNELVPIVQPLKTWKYEVLDRARVKICRDPVAPIEEMTRAKYVKRSNPYDSSVSKHDPFVDWLLPGGMEFQKLPTNHVSDFLTDMELISVRELGTGYVEAIFHQRFPKIVKQHKIVFSRTHGNMPVEVQITIVKSSVPGWTDYLANGKCEWEKQADYWLPKRVAYMYTVFMGKEAVRNEGDFVLDWKVGAQVPDSSFEYAADPRVKLSTLFGFDVDIYDGRRITHPEENGWSLPQEFSK